MKGHIILNLFMLLVVLVVFGALLPIINTSITTLLPELSTADATLIQLLPLAIVVVILASVVGGKLYRGAIE